MIAPSPAVAGVVSSDPNCATSEECWLAAYLAAGGGQYADAIGFHGKACTSDVAECATNDIACPTNELQQCGGTPLLNQIDDVRGILNQYGLIALPIVNTEGGWAAETATKWVQDATADQQAAYFSRFYILQASAGVSISVLFDWCGCSLWTGLGPAAAENEIIQDYTQTYHWLAGANLGGECAEDANDVWSCPLTLPSGQSGLIVWSDSATSYTSAGSFTSYQSLDGTTNAISGAVPIGILPVLLAGP